LNLGHNPGLLGTVNPHGLVQAPDVHLRTWKEFCDVRSVALARSRAVLCLLCLLSAGRTEPPGRARAYRRLTQAGRHGWRA
jgi:hypothetical protein